MKTSDFYYDLPEELIAQEPLEDRASSRLLVVDKLTEKWEHRHFRDIKEYLRKGDCLIINDTRVLPARLYGERVGTGAVMEILLLTRRDLDTWEVLVRPGKKAKPGDKISFGNGRLIAEVLEVVEGGNRIIRFSYEGVFEAILDELGEMPLPPYITHRLEDKERYQTVYAKHEGSAAAPTAGLHFTPGLLKEIEEMGVHIAHVTLHVGLGTFRPVKAEDILEHEMHSEYYVVEQEQADIINLAKKNGGRIFSVGTTSTRTLESVTDENGIVQAKSGWTQIFIYPSYSFKIVDCLITNFHLPESTLIMLVSALVGKDLTMAVYAQAVKERYRFFSFGDACLFLTKP
ncbi:MULTISPECIES: tRNA preQ1(34) S-adenosylmethionine ribosyltransferase-isomerase QueA [Anaerotignum]|uniref:tRNA preQ1(34) S-adenosylmethionine ribosyltransferase-isomerase QueA n=1 Tax=Anaerotignum TaxID=2039240 RepID=UPI00210CBB96|nr:MULTISPECIES: tRNA preQ1(34) S-adenosylmethionine ribosyltransferase-isomerase QueA [Anaerotignum]MCQ4936628.1 tRNA preQ1(34) S-adenosylmethionine ribosyltransferase-isomerase QueA [Anaerotignum propionicum]